MSKYGQCAGFTSVMWPRAYRQVLGCLMVGTPKLVRILTHMNEKSDGFFSAVSNCYRVLRKSA